jgi:hypothetical protein
MRKTAISLEYGKETHRQGRGRNNYFQQHGIEIMLSLNDEILLTPITSKGASDSARLVIPRNHLSAVIKALSDLSSQSDGDRDGRNTDHLSPMAGSITRTETRVA